jgi:3alpha(or 20beta)-hydroxysteroid dehydrogenase
MGRLSGKIALVTGAARGIGAATAALFEREGATVIAADLSLDGGDRLDVSDEASWAAMGDRIARDHGRLDALVNCAGLLKIAPIEAHSVDDYMKIVAVNQLGSFLAIRTAIPLMRERGGSIALLSSLAGLMGSPQTIAYTTSKWAVRGMAKTAAAELLPLKIRVNSVHPGVVDTPMVAGYGDPAQLIRAETVAEMLLFLASDASVASTGTEFVCNGGDAIL